MDFVGRLTIKMAGNLHDAAGIGAIPPLHLRKGTPLLWWTLQVERAILETVARQLCARGRSTQIKQQQKISEMAFFWTLFLALIGRLVTASLPWLVDSSHRLPPLHKDAVLQHFLANSLGTLSPMGHHLWKATLYNRKIRYLLWLCY